MPSKRLVNVLLLFFSVSISLAALALIGEAVVRNRERTRDTVPGTMPFLYYRHERLRFALVRDYDYYQWVHVNRWGFRGPDFPKAKPPNATRVMVVGASTVFDAAVRDDSAAWPARLERHLACLIPDQQIQVINAGVPGYVMLDNLIRLQTELYEFQPDLLILYQAHNDLLAALHRIHETQVGLRRPRVVKAVAPWTQWLRENSLLYTKIAVRLRVMQRAAMAKDAREESDSTAYISGLAGGRARHEKDLRSFLLIARGFGIPVVVPEVVHIGSTDPAAVSPEIERQWQNAVGAPLQHILGGYRQYEDVTRHVTAALGVVYIPLADKGLFEPRWYADGDPVHFNDSGADHMGRSIAGALLETGALSAGTIGRPAANSGACSSSSPAALSP
jgi:lysophospholipase L1-like esterase